MVRDVIDLRASNWIPRREEVNLQSLSFCRYIILNIQMLNLHFFNILSNNVLLYRYLG
jgi:hypothetical protein